MTNKQKKVLYPGTFDPVTLGHLDLIQRGRQLFGNLTVGVAKNLGKKPTLSSEERVELLVEETRDMQGVAVVSFAGLVVDYCRREGYEVILRGLRTVSDFEYEYQMALTNRMLFPGVETIFILPSQKFSFVSSSLIKEILANKGDVSGFLSPRVEEKLWDRLQSGI